MRELVNAFLILPLTVSFAQQFTEQTGISLTGVYASSVAWGDYDNDGDLDILLTGESSGSWVSKVYRNNGDNSFTEQTGIHLSGVRYSSVAWGDYDNDGDLDILLTGQFASSTYLGDIYRNNGNNTFTEQTGSVLGVYQSSVAWGDYDNDGDLDILITGYRGYPINGPVSKIYRNNGNNSFTEQTGISLTGIDHSSVAWGDYDNDGDLDILMTGWTGSTVVSKIYRNNGNNSFTEQTGISLTGVYYSSVAWGDYDNDGDLDILLSGDIGSGTYVSKIYRNNGDNSFTEQTGISLTGVSYSSVAWGDYDNDGDLDILLTGQSGSSTYVSKIYHNNGNNTFTEQMGIGLTGVYESSVAWGDYDNDGDLDILLTGSVGYLSYSVSKIYHNNNFMPNSVPSAPSGLTASSTGSDVTFSWDKPSDTETPQNGLTYNLYVGKTSDSEQVKSPMSDVNTGFRRVVQLGNTNQKNSWTIKNLPGGDYYWSVQAIDNGFTGSSFATKKTYEHISLMVKSPNGGENWSIGNQQNITWSSYGVQNVKIEYTIDGTNWITIVESIPAASDSYSWKVPNAPPTQCRIRISDVGNPNVYDISDNPFTIFYEQFTEQTVISLMGVRYSSVAWGDYDNDGDLDILLTGYISSSTYVSKIYRNNGDNSFTEQMGISLIGVYAGSVAWGDYDNDGDLDILLTGSTGSTGVSKIYRNNGDNSFAEQTGISLTGVYYSSVAWGDYDNDGDLDILLTGSSNSTRVAKIYRNNGDNSFAEQTGISLTRVDRSSVAWGDYDNDGDLDILLTGFTGSSYVSKIYRNNGDNSFTEQTGISLTEVIDGSVAWGDYDNDGDLDILLAGSVSYDNYVSKIYRNNNLTPNSVPSTPSGLTASANGSDVTFSWVKSSDTETSQNGLTYNLYIGTSSDSGQVKSPMSDISSGYRRVVQLGNANKNNSWTIKNMPGGVYYWSVQAMDNSFAGSAFAEEKTFEHSTNIVTEGGTSIPDKFELNQSYPNPFNPVTTIRYALPKSARVILSVYDLNGGVVEKLVDEQKAPGFHSVQWNADGYGSGVYFYRIQADGFQQVKKCLLIK